MFNSVLGASWIHPVGACHSYPPAVFVTTYPVVAVPHGANSDTVTAHVLQLTLVTQLLLNSVPFRLNPVPAVYFVSTAFTVNVQLL